MKQTHLFIIAGEASGDLHGSHLVKNLKKEIPQLTVTGVGGEKLAEAGTNVLYPLANYGVTGFTEVIKQFQHIHKSFKLAKTFIRKNDIDLVILIDYPGFNLRFAKFAKKLGKKVLYYISPQLWAWKPGRISIIKENVDTMAVIFPFEKHIYQRAGVPCYFVGHPLVKTNLNTSNNRYKKLIGLLPGSRTQEIKTLLPIMLEAATKLKQRYPELKFVLPIAPTVDTDFIKSFVDKSPLNIHCVRVPTTELLTQVYCAIVASGTASLEAALCHTPMAIIYKASRLTYCIATQLIQTKYLGLCNLIANKMIVPELLQDDFNSDNLLDVMSQFISDENYHQKTAQRLKKISKMLENNTSDCTLSDLVLRMLNISQLSR